MHRRFIGRRAGPRRRSDRPVPVLADLRTTSYALGVVPPG